MSTPIDLDTLIAQQGVRGAEVAALKQQALAVKRKTDIILQGLIALELAETDAFNQLLQLALTKEGNTTRQTSEIYGAVYQRRDGTGYVVSVLLANGHFEAHSKAQQDVKENWPDHAFHDVHHIDRGRLENGEVILILAN